MPTNTDTTMVQQLSDAGPDGVTLGQSATDKISLYNKTPIVQQTAPTLALSTALPGGACTFMGSVMSLVTGNATVLNNVIAALANIGVYV